MITKTEMLELLRGKAYPDKSKAEIQTMLDEVADWLESAEQVIRCKDCVFFVPESENKDPLFGVPEIGSYCGRFDAVITHGYRNGEPSTDRTLAWVSENDFCSKGKKK